MGNRRRTRASYRIKQNEKLTNTTPEIALDEICKQLGLVLIHSTEVQVPGFTLRPDRRIADTDIILEADGPYHATKIQARKSNWRDDLLVQSGYRVLHIESELLVTHNLADSKRFHPYVADAISNFLLSKESIRYLRA